ncbi:LysR substrate-binding domain-containing protein [Phenylobacterium montanum]|uniref:LysR family transcriptional regulator n=1 Tax=Phenylobacterium montanum TaxID=2823693 RepID=A0A975IVC9_9CAUL|nr:LysR substrate-binding domain-containing protein [Caulobacter sp. S6]QUD88713.1 LysR family transcriptional regulator [Caulobacter sp. S6]
MRFRQVEAFRAVMQSGGVTAAAALLRISQPSVSRLIADLEASVGFTLFERRGGRMVPTDQAQALNEAVRRSFTGLDLLDQAARRIRAHPIGSLRIAALSALAAAVVAPAVKALQAAYPEIKVTVESLGQRAVEDRVFLAQADIGLGVAGPVREGVRSSPLGRARYVCALPAGHALASRETVRLSDLAGEPFIGPMHEADALWFGIDQALAAEGVEVARRLETQQSFTAYAFVESGLGIAIVEPFSAPLFARLGVAVRRLEPDLSVDFAILEPDIGPPPAVAEIFRETALKAAADCLGQTDRLTQM